MKRDYTGKTVGNILNGDFYDLRVSHVLDIANPILPYSISISADPTSSYILKLPQIQGLADQLLMNDGSGNLIWTSPGSSGIGTVTQVGLEVPNFMTVTSTGGNPITSAGIFTISAASTGTGSVVLNTDPTITNLTLNGPLIVSSTEQATGLANNTGALRVSGGMSLEKDSWFGGNMHVNIINTLLPADTLGINADTVLTGDFEVTGATRIEMESATTFDLQSGEGLDITSVAGVISIQTIGPVLLSGIVIESSGFTRVQAVSQATLKSLTGKVVIEALGATPISTIELRSTEGMLITSATGTTDIINTVGIIKNTCGGAFQVQSGAVTINSAEGADITSATGAMTLTNTVGTVSITSGAGTTITSGTTIQITSTEAADITASTGVMALTALTGGISLTTTTGIISLTTTTGGLNLTTGAGVMNLTTGGGLFNITTGGGIMTINTGAGALLMNVGVGGLKGNVLLGEVNFNTSGGAASFGTLAGTTTLYSKLGNVRLEADNGAVLGESPLGGYTLNGGNFVVGTSNGATGFATGDISMTTRDLGIYAGPGNITLETILAHTGLIVLNAKSDLRLWTQSNVDMIYSGVFTLNSKISLDTSAIGTLYSWKFPSTAGSLGQVLTSGGVGSPMTWTSISTGTVVSVAVSAPSYFGVSGSPITSSGTITFTPVTTGTAGSLVLSNAPTLTGETIFGKLSSTGQSNEIISISGLDPNITVASTARSKSVLVGVCDNNNGYVTGSTAGDSIIRSVGGSNLILSTSNTWPAILINNVTQDTQVYYNLVISGASGSGKGAITIINNTTTGNNYNFQLPATAGSAGSLLTSAGGVSAMTWTATTGSGTVVLSTSPTITGAPIISATSFTSTTSADTSIAAGNTLTLASTSTSFLNVGELQIASITSASANGNINIQTINTGFAGPGNIVITTLAATTGNVTINTKGTLTLDSYVVSIVTGTSTTVTSPTLAVTSVTSVTITSPVTTLTTSSATSVAPLEVLNPTQGTGAFTRIYFGREKTTSNCGSLAFYYNGAGSGNNYVALGQFGAERFLVYPGVNIGTIPSQGSALANQIRLNLLEVNTSIDIVSGSFKTTISTGATSNYNFILPTTAGSIGQVLTSQGGGSPMTWTTVAGTGTVTSVAMTVPSFMSITGSPITTSGTLALSASSTGTGSVVLSTSPTLVTPSLGVATATTLTASTYVAATGALAESISTAGAYIGMSGPNAKIELVASANTNLGFIDFTTASPIVDYVGRIIYSHSANTMTFETGNAARVVLSNTNSQINTLLTVSKNRQNVLLTNGTSVESCFIDMQTATNSRRAIIGIDGVGLANFSPGALYLGTITSNHILFATNATERMRILNTGEVVVQNVVRSTPCMAAYECTSVPLGISITGSTSYDINGWTLDLGQSSGDRLTITGASSDRFTNQLGRTVAVTFSYTLKVDTVTGGFSETYLRRNLANPRVAYQTATNGDYMTGTSTILLNNNDYITLTYYNGSATTVNLEYGVVQYVVH